MMSLNTVKVPTLAQLGEVADELGFAFSGAALAANQEPVMPAFEAYNALDRMPDELPPVTYPRLSGRRPRTIATEPGTSRPRSRAPLRASSRAKKSPSRTTSASPGCR